MAAANKASSRQCHLIRLVVLVERLKLLSLWWLALAMLLLVRSSGRSHLFAFQNGWRRTTAFNIGDCRGTTFARQRWQPPVFGVRQPTERGGQAACAPGFRSLYATSSSSSSAAAAASSTRCQNATVATPAKQQQQERRYLSNEEMVRERQRAAAERRAVRQRHVDEQKRRNLHVKAGEDLNLVAVRVYVCPTLREELKLNGRERRGRLFVEADSNATVSLKALKSELHAFFRALRKSTFVLQASLPHVLEDGSIRVETEENDSTVLDKEEIQSWSIQTDEDVRQTFAKAHDFFDRASTASFAEIRHAGFPHLLKRPSFVLHVIKDPAAPPPAPTPPYLLDLPDPRQSESYTMLSFYSFPPSGIDNVEDFCQRLKQQWKLFGALGRVYVATEGVNAQMAIPTNVLDRFMDCCKSIPELGTYMENGVNIDPQPLTLEEFAVAGDMNGKAAPPFSNLHIRPRRQIVADGLLDQENDEQLNWQEAGYDMPPLEWHAKLKAKQKDEDEKVVLLDCRNDYETVVGQFVGAEPLETKNFRDSWQVLEHRLADTPKDTPIMTYCTGGIRCVKVGAYLTQKLGFTNVSRLAGGIIAYDRTLSGKAPEEEPLFRGTNYVFDGRVGRVITQDAMATCVTCGGATNLLSNCRNDNCHKRMVQCQQCRTAYSGTCSEACRYRVEKLFEWKKESAEIETTTTVGDNDDSDASFSSHEVDADEEEEEEDAVYNFTSLQDYSLRLSSNPMSAFLQEVEANTAARIPTGAHMLSGPSQGRLLTQLASLTREGRVLELGTFTAYATACLWDGVASVPVAQRGDGNRTSGPFVMTMERDDVAVELALAHLKIMSQSGTQGKEAMEQLRSVREEGNGPALSNDTKVEQDDKNDHGVYRLQYRGAGCEIVHTTDALATMEQIARGQDAEVAPFDMVFVDADKTRLLDYVEACVSNNRLLKKGGLIVVDNVLFKGLVLDVAAGGNRRDEGQQQEEENDDDNAQARAELKKSRRARKLALVMHKFNAAIVKDKRVEVTMLSLRDGLSLIRKL